jgi:DNA primase
MQVKKRFSLVEREQIAEKAQKCLWNDPGEPGRKYLLEKRGLSEETLREFRLGFIPTYVQHQLAGRIILPLYDPSGNLIAIGSRAIGDKTFLPVYWHESYQKPFYLYGISQAYPYIRKVKFVIVVEGQFDVLQLANHGIRNVVGLCGNKMSEVQISVIHRYCKEIVLLLDSDENLAGQRGADKILAESRYEYDDQLWDSSRPEFPVPWHQQQPHIVIHRDILSVTLPEKSDPDEFVRKHGVDELRKLIKGKRREFREV